MASATGWVKMTIGREGIQYSSPTAGICCAILVRAAEDWRWLIKERAWRDRRFTYRAPTVSFDELRAFFKSDWCQTLIPKNMPITNLDMLEHLEEELRKAIEKDKAGR